MPNLIDPFQIKANDVAKDTFAFHLQVGQFTTDWHAHSKHQLLYAEQGVVHLQTSQHHFLLPASPTRGLDSGTYCSQNLLELCGVVLAEYIF